MTDSRTHAERIQDAYAQAGRAYDAALTAEDWAFEDRQEKGGDERLTAAIGRRVQAYMTLKSALATFQALSDGERRSVSLRDPLNADGTIMSPPERNRARQAVCDAGLV